jgi:hypothetical protein
MEDKLRVRMKADNLQFQFLTYVIVRYPLSDTYTYRIRSSFISPSCSPLILTLALLSASSSHPPSSPSSSSPGHSTSLSYDQPRNLSKHPPMEPLRRNPKTIIRTLALVLFALAHHLNLQGLGRAQRSRSGDLYNHKDSNPNSNSTPSFSTRTRTEDRREQEREPITATPSAGGGFGGPTFLLLLPNTTLLAQVERWLEAIYPNPLSDPNFGPGSHPGLGGNGNRIYRAGEEERKGEGGGTVRGKVWECVYPRTRSKRDNENTDVKDDRVLDSGVERWGGEEREVRRRNDLDFDVRLGPDILISTPSALWDRLQPQAPLSHFEAHQEAGWLTIDRLRKSLEVVAMDEPDAIIRPLPGRYDQQQQPGDRYGGKQHVFHRHPPVGVKLLEALLPGRPEGRRHAGFKGTHGSADGAPGGRKKVQTVWTSATVNSQLRGYIVKRGWARPRGEGGVVLEPSGASETIDVKNDGKGRNGDAVKHACWVVDPDTGEHTDLSEPVALDGSTGNSRSGMTTNDESQEALAATTPGPGEIHPYLIESLALHWASRSGSGKSLVIPPNGTSVRKLQDTLSELGCPSVSLDVDSRETARQVGLALQEGHKRLDESDEERFEEDGSEHKEIGSDSDGAVRDTLYILPRSHIRGIDIPDIKTVYLLGGLGIKDVKGASTGAAVWAEKEREYLHWVGRMGRLSGTKLGENRDGTIGSDTIVTLVLKGPEEILMRKFMEKMKEKRQEATV